MASVREIYYTLSIMYNNLMHNYLLCEKLVQLWQYLPDFVDRIIFFE